MGKFKPGDNVRLRSGGPTLTVIRLNPDDGEAGISYTCRYWNVPAGDFHLLTVYEHEIEVSTSVNTLLYLNK